MITSSIDFSIDEVRSYQMMKLRQHDVNCARY